MKNLSELQVLIIDWADKKGLNNPVNAPKQRLKLLEEIGETAKAILQHEEKEIKDGIGDIFVVLVILYTQLNIRVDLSSEPFDKQENLGHQDRLMSLIYYHDCSGFEELYYFCQENKYDLTECANIAWNEIKDRKGKLVDGTFIKEN